MNEVNAAMRSAIRLVLQSGLIYLFLLATLIGFWSLFFDNTKKDIAPFLGQFGDFFGGMINPFLSFLNVFAFVLVTTELHRMSEAVNARDQQVNEANNERALQVSRQVAVLQLQHAELLNYIAVMDDAIENWAESPFNGELMLRMFNARTMLTRRMIVAFPNMDEMGVVTLFNNELDNINMNFIEGRPDIAANRIESVRFFHGSVIIELGRIIFG